MKKFANNWGNWKRRTRERGRAQTHSEAEGPPNQWGFQKIHKKKEEQLGKLEEEKEAAQKLKAKLKDPQINEHYEEYRQDKEENLKGLEEENEATKNNVSQPQDLIWETER